MQGLSLGVIMDQVILQASCDLSEENAETKVMAELSKFLVDLTDFKTINGKMVGILTVNI